MLMESKTKQKQSKNRNKTMQKRQNLQQFCLFVFPPGTSLTEAANTVFFSGKQSVSSVPDLRTGKENYMCK